MATRQVVQRFVGHTAEIVSIRLTADKQHVITAARDLHVKFWNVDTGAVDAEAVAFDVSAPTNVSVSPLNDQFIMGAMKLDIGSGAFRSQLDSWTIRR